VARELQSRGFSAALVRNRRPRWRLRLDSNVGASAYGLEDALQGTRLAAGSLEPVLTALLRG
ncbi:MAG: hypothetical protein ACYDCQ_16470, partial [Dehalococcoidia bacterium]